MTIDDLPPITPDPVIEAYKKDVDRTLLRESLKRTPAERFDEMEDFMASAWEMRRAVAEAKRARREAGATS